MENDVQKIPLRIYQSDTHIMQSDTHIMVAAPMPGVEPGDVSVTIEGDKLIIEGHERGVGQNRRDVLVDEWKIGPYYRETSLPQAVDGSLTNATYGNGVLLLSMPKAHAGEAAVRTEIQLQEINATRGERVGHAGSEIRPANRHASD